MSSESSVSLDWILSSATFGQISTALCQVVEDIQDEGNLQGEAIILTEAAIPGWDGLATWSWRFVLVVSPRFSGLLQGHPLEDALDQVAYQVNLSFEPSAIAAFISQLQTTLLSSEQLQSALALAQRILQPNQPDIQSQFTLHLVTLLALDQPRWEKSRFVAKQFSTTGERRFEQPVPERFATTPASNELEKLHDLDQPRQPIDNEHIFTAIATQIRQTQELSRILTNALQLICPALQADRALIYQFEPNPSPAVRATAQAVCGRITYETRSTDAIPRILNLSEGAQCFIGVPNYKEKYCKGATQAVDNIELTYLDAPCLVNLLKWAQVKAKLVVPIVVQEDLWGLLIVHQCNAPRVWQKDETRFLSVIAELLAIAIYQTNLYGQLQHQAQTLEKLVIERTQELHDALNAAQSANLAKTEFLASISHELRTPLTAVIGMAKILLRMADSPQRERLLTVERQQDYLKIIHKSGEHLLELINDILDLSQVESGRTVLDIQEFSLTQAATDCVRMLRDRAQQRQIKLETEFTLRQNGNISGAGGDRFSADPRRVKQIVLNLLSNAIKFTPEGGTVTLRLWTEAGKAFFQVEDTGIGIEEHQFPLLFKKFQQLDTSYHRQYEGTGLGLALTKQLTELHGGRVTVESTVNVGSTFTVWLPAQPLSLKRTDSSALSANNEAAPPPEGRVVLIENHEQTATLLCDLLTAAGHQVVWMIDGLTAIQQIEILKPDLVMINSQLSGVSASEILHQLRHSAGAQASKVLMLTAQPTGADSDRWLTEGATACLPVPITYPEQLLSQVAALMR